MIKLINFRLHGRFGHFLRADAGASAISYPIPPRTVIMGIMGAVLGLPKDQPQELLEPMHVALSGKIPVTHWHKAKLRKDPPESLSYIIKRSQKQEKNTKPEKATLITQEWLFNPSYEVWVGLPEPYHTELENRIKERKWYFQPSLGLSELMADIEYIDSISVDKLPEGTYSVETVIRQDYVQLDIEKCYNEKLAINLLRMPRTVTPKRVFSHANYFMEKDARPIPLKTSEAYLGEERVLMFL
ncbi:CRISPR-associated protein Cas5 [Pelotomaculum propionicicum]|nr:CRISPR-associated protein Cas5 [Pelotomaculum propionicicum]